MGRYGVRYLALPAALLLALLCLAGCTAYSSEEVVREAAAEAYDFEPLAMDAMDDVEWVEPDTADYAMPQETGGVGGIGDELETVTRAEQDDRKRIVTVSLSMQTKEFDTGAARIEPAVERFGGYVQSSYIEGKSLDDTYRQRSAHFTVRIPVERLEQFLGSMDESFNVVSRNRSEEDITLAYYDTESRLSSLRIQQERLLEMLADPSGDLEYLLQVEQALAEVQYRLEYYTTARNRMDDSINYATVTIYLDEVLEYDEDTPIPITLGERAGRMLGDSWGAFVGFLQGIVLALVALVPFLPLLAVIAAVVLILLRRRRRGRKAALADTAGEPRDTPGEETVD